jgi:hypothetical protein
VGKIKAGHRRRLQQTTAPVQTSDALLDTLAFLNLPTAARMVAVAIHILAESNGGWCEASAERIGWLVGIARRHSIRLIKLLVDEGCVLEDTSPGRHTRRKVAVPKKPEEIKGKGREEGINYFRWGVYKDMQTGEVIDRSTIERRSLTLIREFQNNWARRYRGKCHVSGKDRTRAVELVKSIGLEDALARLGRYMKDDDKWLRDRKHPFAVFVAKSNQYYRDGGGQDAEAEIARGDYEDEVRKSAERSRRRREARGDAVAKRDR